MIDTTPTEPKLQFGQVVSIEGVDYGVTAVSSAGPEGAQYGHRYELMLFTEVEELRTHNVQHAAEQAERAELEQHARVIGIQGAGVDNYPTNQDLQTAIDAVETQHAELVTQAEALGETDTSYMKYPSNAKLADFINKDRPEQQVA